MPTPTSSTESSLPDQNDSISSFFKILDDVNQWIFSGFTKCPSRYESQRKNLFLQHVEKLQQETYLTHIAHFFQDDFKTYNAFETFYSNFQNEFNLPRFIDIELLSVYVIFTIKCFKQLPSLIKDEKQLVILLTATLNTHATPKKPSICPEILELLDDDRLFDLISNVHRLRYLIENIQPLELIQFEKILSVLKKRPNEWLTNGDPALETDDFIELFKSLNEDALNLLWELIRTTKFEWILTSEEYLKFIEIPVLAKDEIKRLEFVLRMAPHFNDWISRSDELHNLFEPIQRSSLCYLTCWARITAEFHKKPELQKFENISTCKNIRQDDRNAFQKDVIDMALCCKPDELGIWVFLLKSNTLPKEDRIKLYDSFKDKGASLKPRSEYDLPTNDETSESEWELVDDDQEPTNIQAFPNTAIAMESFPEHPKEERTPTTPHPSSTLSPSDKRVAQTPPSSAEQSLEPRELAANPDIQITNAEEFKNYWRSDKGKSSKPNDLDEKKVQFTSWITYVQQIVDLFDEWEFTEHLPIVGDLKKILIEKAIDTIIEHRSCEELLSLIVCKQLSNTERTDILLKDPPPDAPDSEKTLAEYFLKDVKDFVTLFTQLQFDASKDKDLKTLLIELLTNCLNQRKITGDLMTLLKCNAISTMTLNEIFSKLSADYLKILLVTQNATLTALFNTETLDLVKLIENPEFPPYLARLEKKMANKSDIKTIETGDALIKSLKQLRSLYRMQLLNPSADSSQCFSFFSQDKSPSLQLKIKAIDIFLSEIEPPATGSIESSDPQVNEKRNKGRIGLLVNRWIELGQPKMNLSSAVESTTSAHSTDSDRLLEDFSSHRKDDEALFTPPQAEPVTQHELIRTVPS